jgi:tetratricopeptide (TPR) repeat protein
MRKLVLGISIVLSIHHSSFAENEADSLHHLALYGIDLATTLQYDKAIDVFERVIAADPDNPMGYFLRSAAYFWMFSADMHNEELGETFKELSYEAVDVAERRLELDETDIDARFFLGGAYGSLGRYYGMKRSFLKAYWYGKKGVNILEDVVEQDSTYYDAYLGLGIYHYLADVLPRFVKILSFLLGIDGDRERGIQELVLAVDKGTYVQTEAMFFLGAIYTYREREYDKALNIWHDLLKKYPDNPGVLIHMGRCYANRGKCYKAVEIYKKILENREKASLIPMTSIHYQLGNVQYKLNEYNSAISSFQESIRIDTSSVENRRWTYEWAHYWIGESYTILGDDETAQTYYNQINEDNNSRAFERAQERMNNPLTTVNVQILIGRNNITCQRYHEALEIFSAQRDNLIGNPDKIAIDDKNELTFYIGETLYHMGRYRESISELNDLLVVQNLGADLKAWAHYHRGNSYKAIGNTQRALEDFKKSVEMDDPIMVDKIKNTILTLEKN